MDVRKALLAPIALLLTPIALLLMTGCSGSGTAAPGPATLPPLASASASPSPTVVALPPEATPDTPQAAGAFARFYLAEVDRALSGGDVSVLQRLSHAECGTCDNYISAAEDAVKQGLQREGGEVRVRFAEASQTKPGDAIVDITFEQSPSLLRDGAGQVVRRSEGQQKGFMQMRVLRPPGAGWVARAIRFPEVPQ